MLNDDYRYCNVLTFCRHMCHAKRQREREKDSHCGPTGVWISQCQGKAPFQDWRVFLASFPCFIFSYFLGPGQEVVTRVRSLSDRMVDLRQTLAWHFHKANSQIRLCIGEQIVPEILWLMGGEVPRLVSGCTGNGWFLETCFRLPWL